MSDGWRKRLRERAVQMSSQLELVGWPVLRLAGTDFDELADAAHIAWALGRPSILDVLAGRWDDMAARGVPLVTFDVTAPQQLAAAVDILGAGVGVIFCSPEAYRGLDEAWLRSLVGSGVLCAPYLTDERPESLGAALQAHRTLFGQPIGAVATAAQTVDRRAMAALRKHGVRHVFLGRPGLATPTQCDQIPRLTVGRDVEVDLIETLLGQPRRVQALEMLRLKAVALGEHLHGVMGQVRRKP